MWFMDDDGIIDDVAPSPLALSAEPGRRAHAGDAARPDAWRTAQLGWCTTTGEKRWYC